VSIVDHHHVWLLIFVSHADKVTNDSLLWNQKMAGKYSGRVADNHEEKTWLEIPKN
jgi:hypothetical protein